MASLLPSTHPYYAAPPAVPASFTPDICGSLVIDAWDFSTLATSGTAPDETTSRAMYRTVASIADKYLTSEQYLASGDVRHTRPDEEPYGAIDTVRGRRSLLFANTAATPAYITTTLRSLRGASFNSATPSRPLTVTMHVRFRGGAARNGDGTIFDRNGWSAKVSADLTAVTLTAPASATSGSWTFPLPHPVAGFVRCALSFQFDGTKWTMGAWGQSVAASASTPFTGNLVSTVGTAMTIGGSATGGLEMEIDLFRVGTDVDRTVDLTQWRWDAPVSMSWGQTFQRHLADLAVPDGYYSIFQGDDGAGLTTVDITSLVDGNGADFFSVFGSSKNRLALVRVSGNSNRNITSQATYGTRYVNRSATNGAFINVSGGGFMATGTELRLTYAGSAVCQHTLLKGIAGGGPSSYGSQAQAEGTVFFLLGQQYSATATPLRGCVRTLS